MKKKITSIMFKVAGFLPALALLVGIAASKSPCFTFYYQPEAPKALDAYRH